jgi:cytochrome c oxidase subunit IV
VTGIDVFMIWIAGSVVMFFGSCVRKSRAITFASLWPLFAFVILVNALLNEADEFEAAVRNAREDQPK